MFLRGLTKMARILKYKEAISDALCEAMQNDQSILVTGIGVDYSSGIFGTTLEALKRFPDRVFESPAMENALTGIAIGAAAVGMRPVVIHARCDFSFLAFDQLINLAAKWKYMYGGNAGTVPIVVRMIIGRGWGQGATHSQSLQSVLGHFPGLKVLMPATPNDAKWMTIEALTGDCPTVLIEHRSLYELADFVADEGEEYPFFPFGDDVTICATSYALEDAKKASDILAQRNIHADVICWNRIRPIDDKELRMSVQRTGRLVICDTSWGLYGVSAEIAAIIVENTETLCALQAPVQRVVLADCPAPVAYSLEQQFYPGVPEIVRAVYKTMGRPMIEIVEPGKQPAFMGPY